MVLLLEIFGFADIYHIKIVEYTSLRVQKKKKKNVF